jgi:hypothetical protein
MSNYFDRPDGETFVDTATKPIPPADTWHTMSVNQLLEVQIHLQSRAWEFRNNPPIVAALNLSVARLEGLMAQKLRENS